MRSDWSPIGQMRYWLAHLGTPVLKAAVAFGLLAIPGSLNRSIVLAEAAQQPISALALKDLVDRSTIELGSSGEKVYISLALTNTLRRSSLLGPDFLTKHVRKDLVAETGFVGLFKVGGKLVPITGVGGIGQDKESGSGLIFLVQTFPGDSTVPKFAGRDRLYSVMLISETENGFNCRHSRWEKMFSFKGTLRFTEDSCTLVDGNFWLKQRQGDAGINEAKDEKKRR